MTDNLEMVRYDYLTMSMSLSQLAEKYGTTKSSMNRLVKKFGWDVEKRMLYTQIEHKARTPAKKKPSETKIESETTTEENRNDFGETGLMRFIEEEAERRGKVYDATDRLLELVNRMLENAEAMAPRDLQSMSTTLMNIKQLHDIRPPEEDKANASINVHMTGDVSSWAE